MKIEKSYTVKEAAEMLSITPNALRIRISRGQLKAHKPNPVKQGNLYIPESELLAYMDKLGIKYTK